MYFRKCTGFVPVHCSSPVHKFKRGLFLPRLVYCYAFVTEAAVDSKNGNLQRGTTAGRKWKEMKRCIFWTNYGVDGLCMQCQCLLTNDHQAILCSFKEKSNQLALIILQDDWVKWLRYVACVNNLNCHPQTWFAYVLAYEIKRIGGSEIVSRPST